jgi:hypothetical protein
MIFIRLSLSSTPWPPTVGFIAVKQATGPLKRRSSERCLIGPLALRTHWKSNSKLSEKFRRRTLDPLHERIQGDTLFCLALMQHHGAPTRLLDGSYSPFVAAAFAMERGPKRPNPPDKEIVPVVWCFSLRWLRDQTKNKTKHKNAFRQRNKDDKRGDATFLKLYNLGPKAKPDLSEQFVKSENPLHLNERLTTQQGVFLCPGDLTRSFVDNIKSMDGWRSKDSVVKLRLEMAPDKATEFVRNLKSMNLSFAALFPGLEGFARSIGQQLFHYKELAKTGAGLSHYLSNDDPSETP